MEAVILIGRFNPLTRGHHRIIQLLYNYTKMKPFIFIVDGEKSSLNKTKNPLTAFERKHILKTMYPDISLDIVSSAYEVLDVLNVQGYQLKVWITGCDRTNAYRQMTNYAGLNCTFVEIERNNENIVSATMAREAARSNNLELFTSYMPEDMNKDFIKEMMYKIKNRTGV